MWHSHFAVVEAMSDDKQRVLLKVSMDVLRFLRSGQATTFFTWSKGGCWQSGVQRQDDVESDGDAFLLHETSNILPSQFDESYRPDPVTFEPWAVDYEKHDLSSGYGLTAEDDFPAEPWMYRYLGQKPGFDVTTDPLTHGDAGNKIRDPMQRHPNMLAWNLSCSQRDGVRQAGYDRQCIPSVTAASSHDEDQSIFEPWAAQYVSRSHHNYELLSSDDDQFPEPWSMSLVPSHQRLTPVLSFSQSGQSQHSGAFCQEHFRGLPSWMLRACEIIPPLACLLGRESKSTCDDPGMISRWCKGFQEKVHWGFNSWNVEQQYHDHHGSARDHIPSSVGVPMGPESKHLFSDDWSWAIPVDTPVSDQSIPILHSGPGVFHACMTEIKSIHFARSDVNHIAFSERARDDLFTLQSNFSTNYGGGKFQAGCIAFLKAVRDAAIPPCLFFLHQRPICRVSRHNPSRISDFRNVRFSPQFHRPGTDLFQSPAVSENSWSKQVPMFWYVGHCKSGDYHLDYQALQHQTITRGAVPDLTTTARARKHVSDSDPAILHEQDKTGALFSCIRSEISDNYIRSFCTKDNPLTAFDMNMFCDDTVQTRLPPQSSIGSQDMQRRDASTRIGVLMNMHKDLNGPRFLSPILFSDCGSQGYDDTPFKGDFVSMPVPRYQNNDIVVLMPQNAQIFSDFDNILALPTLQHSMNIRKSGAVPIGNRHDQAPSLIRDHEFSRQWPQPSDKPDLFQTVPHYPEPVQFHQDIWPTDADLLSRHERLQSNNSFQRQETLFSGAVPDNNHTIYRCIADMQTSVFGNIYDAGGMLHYPGAFEPVLLFDLRATSSRRSSEYSLPEDAFHPTARAQGLLHLKICYGAVPTYAHPDRDQPSFRAHDLLQLWLAHSDGLDLSHAMLQFPETVPLSYHQRSSIGTREVTYSTTTSCSVSADYVSDSQIRIPTVDGGHQVHRCTPSRGEFAFSHVPRHQNNDGVLPAPPCDLPCQDLSNVADFFTLQSLRRPIYLTSHDLNPQQYTTSRGAVPNPNTFFCDVIWPRVMTQGIQIVKGDDIGEFFRRHTVHITCPQGSLWLSQTSDRRKLCGPRISQAVFMKLNSMIATSGSSHQADRVLLFDVKTATQRLRQETTPSGAVPDPSVAMQNLFQMDSTVSNFDHSLDPQPRLLHDTSSSGTVPANDRDHFATFRGWSEAIYAGGHPAWGRCEVIHMAPNPPFAERCAAASQDNGWLASDEALWFLRLLKQWRSDIAVGPIIQWSPSRDLQHLMAAEDQLQCYNGYLNILLFLVEAHWCAVEIDRRTEPVHVVLIQWPQEHQTMVVLEVSRILQISPSRILVTMDSTNEVVTMCGWTILFRWYTNFAMQTCLQPLTHATDQVQAQIDSVLHRAHRHWDRTNAPSSLRLFAAECRRAFMSEYARDQPDTRLPNGVSTVMFVGPQEEYLQEASQVPRPPTHREREINWLRNMLIQPAWLTNFEVELVLQMIRMQILDRFLPGPLHFDPVTNQLEPFINDLPSVAGYTKVLFFVTLNYHWISISGTQHQNRWMLTAVVPDPRSRDLPPLFDAVAAVLETSPDRVHIQAIPRQSPPHLCGWLLLYSLHEHCQTSPHHDPTMLLQRIAVMPNSRIKNLIFEEALSTWTRHAPHQNLVTFATQVRTYFLAHMDTWSSHHVLRFGGMFPQSTPPSMPASWTAISKVAKAKILAKIRSHVQRPYVCSCVDRLTAFVEIDRMVEANETLATFIAYIKPSPLQWASHFCQENVLPAPCSHDRITEFVLQVPSRSADLIPPHVEAIIYQGRVQFLRSQVVVLVHDLESGIRIFRKGRNYSTTNLDVGELCSGAFSGWTQATKVLSTLGYPIQTKFAVDHDHCVATWYARNYTDSAIAAQPDDVFKLRDECFYYREAPITLQTDVSLGWYLLFCEPVDIITASPPCPAFSNASTAAGLEKQEGQVIVDTILKILVLQPKIMVLEEVASLRTHAHFPLILELLNWGNFQVAWQEVLNLDDWLPQSRPRLILIAFRRCSYGLKHFACKAWNSRPSRSLSLQDSHCLLTDEAIIEVTSAPLDLGTAKLYFDPNKIPGATPRSFKDVLRFRLRTPDDRVQCIMASYAYGHEIDADSLSQKGIFGSLLRHQGRLRFLAGPELLWLQGLSVEWQGPLNPRLLNHIIGNAISVPHALVGLFNVLGHFTHLEFDSFPHELFLTAFASRLHAQNSDCIIDIHTGTFAITPKLVPATDPWDMSFVASPPSTKVIFLQGNKRRTISVQSGISILPVFAILFCTYEVAQITWLPFDCSDLALPIVDADIFSGAQMVFVLPDSFRLCLQEQSFSTLASA